MERRRSERIPFTIDAEITSEGKTYHGSIENVSEGGMEYLITSFVQASKDFTPDKRVELKFRAPSGEELNLSCDVKWFLKTEQGEEKLMLGMEIIDPPQKYKEWVKKLYVENSKDKPA